MPYLISPILNESQIDGNGNPLTGGLVYTYEAGTSTPRPTYTDINGLTIQSNPIVLNTLGQTPQPLWLDSSLTYKFIIKNSLNVTQRTIDNISGISSQVSTQDQWINYQNSIAFINAASLSTPGDQRNIFQVGRRIKTVNTGGIVYSTILSSSFGGSITTITLSNDGGSLDGGLSSLSYALLSVTNPSIPATVVKYSYQDSVSGPTILTTGVAPAYVFTTANPEKFKTPFSLSAGSRLRLQFHANGTTGSNTLNQDGLGAVSIKQYDSSGTKVSGIVKLNQIADVEYDGTDYVVLDPLPPTIIGRVVAQVQTTAVSTVATGTTIIPFDNTILQNTEGDQYMTLTITPTNVNSLLEIDIVIYLSNSGSSGGGVGLFQDSTANALAVGTGTIGTGGGMLVLKHVMTAGTVSATTFKVRAGASAAGTTTFNGAGGTQLFGGVYGSKITIKEYLP